MKSLVVTNSELASLPESIGELTNLEALSFYGNNLVEIPETIGNLSQLKSLNIFSNQLKELPASIGKLTKLEWLSIYENELSSLPKSIGNLTQLKQIHAERNELTSIPSTIGQLVQINSLRLGENRLSTLPDEIGQLKNISYLTLYNNQIKYLPNTFANLEKIEQLDLQNNQLEEIPTAVVAMSGLTTLRLTNNQISVLPSFQGRLKKLKTLGLSNNQITTLSPSIEHLTQLETLNLRNNKLSELPETITYLKALTQLYLGKNELKELPQQLNNLSVLKTLELYENPIPEEERNRIRNLLPNCSIDLFPNENGNRFEEKPKVTKNKEEQVVELIKEGQLEEALDLAASNKIPPPKEDNKQNSPSKALNIKVPKILLNNWNDTVFVDFRNQVLQLILEGDLEKAINLFPDDKLYEKTKLKEKLAEVKMEFNPRQYKYEQWSIELNKIQHRLIESLPPQQTKITPISAEYMNDLLYENKVDKALQLAINSGYENMVHQQARLNRTIREYQRGTIDQRILNRKYAQIKEALQYNWK